MSVYVSTERGCSGASNCTSGDYDFTSAYKGTNNCCSTDKCNSAGLAAPMASMATVAIATAAMALSKYAF